MNSSTLLFVILVYLGGDCRSVLNFSLDVRRIVVISVLFGSHFDCNFGYIQAVIFEEPEGLMAFLEEAARDPEVTLVYMFKLQ